MSAPDDVAVREAMSRLNALYELDPATRPRNSRSWAGVAFAIVSWATLALLLAELQPWRL